MHILISNDDGFQATGINTLNKELSKSFQTTLIAPDRERSSCGHAITLGEPLRVKEISPSVYSCTGFPADCVLIGIGNILKDSKPDLVVSGINHGANLGQDRYYSGTIAAAREASFRGLKSISVSLVNNYTSGIEYFDVAAQFIAEMVQSGIHQFIPDMCVLNINVPNLPWEKISGLSYVCAGFQMYTEEVIERTDTRAQKYFWVGGSHQGFKSLIGSDCNAVDEGFISIDLQSHTGKEVAKESVDIFIQELSKIKWKRNLHFTHS